MFEKFLKSDIDRCVNTIVDGQTLLIIAIKHGHYAIVEFLISKCNVDIEQVGVLVRSAMPELNFSLSELRSDLKASSSYGELDASSLCDKPGKCESLFIVKTRFPKEFRSDSGASNYRTAFISSINAVFYCTY